MIRRRSPGLRAKTETKRHDTLAAAVLYEFGVYLFAPCPHSTPPMSASGPERVYVIRL